MTYSGDYSGHRFSPLDQISVSTAQGLTAKWVYQTGATGKLETTPLVVDGVLYATAQDDRAFALDARTGRPIWMYQHQLPGDIRPCCGRVNRGFAILGDKVFLGTLDAHVIALDSKTGNVIWDIVAADYHKGYSFTVAPLVVKNLSRHRSFRGRVRSARLHRRLRCRDGDAPVALLYRARTRASPDMKPGKAIRGRVGGAPAWNTGTYDPATNQIFWPTGNPSPIESRRRPRRR